MDSREEVKVEPQRRGGILSRLRSELDLPVLTDVHSEAQTGPAAKVDYSSTGLNQRRHSGEKQTPSRAVGLHRVDLRVVGRGDRVVVLGRSGFLTRSH